jgi:TP901 family phage tail tape measure protein
VVKIGEISIEISATTSRLRANLAQASSLIRDFSLLSQGLTAGISEAFRQISAIAIRGLQVSLIALGGAFTLAAKTGADFEDEMVRAFTILKEGGNATSDSMVRMTSTALELGRETLFSAIQAAQGMQILARAGFDTREILDSIRPALDLAIVGNMELAESSNIVISALRGFNLETRDAAKVADILALGSSKANTTVQELGNAFRYVAPVAAGAGMSIEETVAAIGVLSNAGIKGSMAGTTLRRALSQLLAPSNKAKKVMNELGVSFLDSSGRLKPFVSIIRDLQKAGMTASQAMQMFGLRAGPGMIALVNAGANSISRLESALEGAKGTAEDMSQAFRTTVKGRVRDLMASIVDLGLAFSEKFKKPLSDAIFAVRNFIVDIVNIGNRMGTFKAIVEGVKSALEPITNLIKLQAEAFKKWLAVLTPREISKFFSDLRGDIDAFIKSLTEGEAGAIIKETFEIIIGLGKTLIKVIAGITKAWMSLPEGVRDVLRPMLIVTVLILKMFGGLMNIIFLMITLNALWAALGLKITLAKALGIGLGTTLLFISKLVLIIGAGILAWKIGTFIGNLSIVKGLFTSITLMVMSIGPSLKLAAMGMLAISQPWRLLNKEFRADMARTIQDIKVKAGALKEIDWLGTKDKKPGADLDRTEIPKITGGLIGPSGEVITPEGMQLTDEINRLKSKLTEKMGDKGQYKLTQDMIDLTKLLMQNQDNLRELQVVQEQQIRDLFNQTSGKTDKDTRRQPRINSAQDGR